MEYKIIRNFFPGPLSVTPNIWYGIEHIFSGKGFFSLTTIISLTLALIFPITLVIKNKYSSSSQLTKFFLINAYIFPLWIIFYRVLSGNISEFRIMWPMILPCVYGISLNIDLFENNSQIVRHDTIS